MKDLVKMNIEEKYEHINLAMFASITALQLFGVPFLFEYANWTANKHQPNRKQNKTKRNLNERNKYSNKENKYDQMNDDFFNFLAWINMRKE